jgi:hypothetical protein
MATRRALQVFSLPFLDMVTNYLGAVIILFLVAAQAQEQKPCPAVKMQLEAFVDSTGQYVWAKDASTQLAYGDSILLVIKDTLNMPGQGGGGGQQLGQIVVSGGVQYIPTPCRLQHCTHSDCPPCPPPGQCGVYATYSEVQCNGQDAFTFMVNVQEVGECGSTWRDAQGRTGNYGTPTKYGPFLLASGKQTLVFQDVNKSGTPVRLEVEPPTNCRVAPPPMPEQPGGSGQINFIVEFDETAGDRVGIRVKKGNKTVWINNKSEPEIGYFSTRKPQELSLRRPKTGVREVYQSQPIPGIYEIYLEGTEGKGPVKAKLWIGSKPKPLTTKSYDLTLPLNQRQLVRKVEVLADGSIKIIQ